MSHLPARRHELKMPPFLTHPDIEVIPAGGHGCFGLVAPGTLLAALIVRAQRQAPAHGFLFSSSPVQAYGDGRALVNVRIVELQRPTAPVRPVSAATWWACGGIATLIAAVVATAALVAWHYRAVILGALALAVAVWWLLGRAGACPGLHCPGCSCS